MRRTPQATSIHIEDGSIHHYDPIFLPRHVQNRNEHIKNQTFLLVQLIDMNNTPTRTKNWRFEQMSYRLPLTDWRF